MESLHSPYLEAIQRIEGSTPGEKYRVLNKAAIGVVNLKAKNADIDPIAEIKSSFNIPDPLIPLVHVEVSKILRDPEGIIEALKSEDTLVFGRALKTKWFFDGTNPNITNAKYYENYILPHLSLNNRILLVKKLAMYLCSPMGDKSSIAEDFYTELSGKYGKKLGKQLLIACSESFIQKLIIEDRKINLNSRLMKTIYRKYPNVIIQYLKLSKPSDDGARQRNSGKVNIYEYTDFLPLLLKRDIKFFIELIEMHKSSLQIKFSRTRTELFMKQGIDALLRSPQAFLPMMPLKVTTKLTKSQFQLMFKNLFPKEIDEFRFKHMFGYLDYYQEKEDRIALLLSTFEEIYHVNLLDCDEQVTPELMAVLPVDERVKQARKKLETDKDWHLGTSWYMDRSWRCYLTTDESIPLIKKQITKSSLVNHRRDLLQQMIFTCSINNDQNALLETLKYISMRHKNEQGWLLLEVLGTAAMDFKWQYLTLEHWEILNNLIQLLYVKDEIHSSGTIVQIIVTGIHFNLINNLSIDDKINLLFEVNRKLYHPNWNILQDYPDYEKKCLDTFLTTIAKNYPQDKEIREDLGPKIVIHLVQALYNFNARNSKNRKSKLKNFSLKNYPWLLESVKTILNDKKKERWMAELAEILKDGEKDLYDTYVVDKPEEPLINFQSTEILILLKRNPDKIKENWDKYLEELQKNTDGRLTIRFMRSCRWYQELPIKFSKKCLSDFMAREASSSLDVLALLYEGSALERVVTPFMPKISVINANDESAKSDFSRTFQIASALKLVNPPVSLDVVLALCIGDYIHTAIRCVLNVCRRVSVDKVIPFTMKLMDKGVSIKKQGLRIFMSVASMDEMRIMVTNLLRNEKHRSIRAIVFSKILELFIDEPSQATWSIMQEAIGDLKPDDDAITSMTYMVSKIPDEFVADYVRRLLNAIKKLEDMEDGFDTEQAVVHFRNIMNGAVKVSDIFSEKLHGFILGKYFADLTQPDYPFSPSTRYYIVRGYLMNSGGKLEQHLEYLSHLLSEIIEKYWDVESQEKPGLLLGNHMVYSLTQEVIQQSPLCTPIMKAIVQSLFKTFFSLLKPTHEPTSYLYLTYASLFETELSSKEFAQKIVDILPNMIEILSSESLSLIAKILHEFLSKRISQYEWKSTELDIVESLLEFENENSAILASMLLLDIDSKINNQPRFWRIVKNLQKHQHPAVISNVYMCVNRLESM